MPRPDFSEINTFEEFSKYYWYREELQKICRTLGLKSDGGKIELNKVIESYFNGEKLLPEKLASSRHSELVSGTAHNKSQKKIPKRVEIDQSIMLSLDSSLIECGFTFGPRFREFFEKETAINPFKFNVDMVATVKKVKETNNTNFSLGDLLEIYYGRKTYAKYDKSALQWNKFVQDFCADPATERFPNKLKVAAKLWKIVRESTREKVYTHDLLNELNIL
ncbi:MAG: SAP domain-containing protein [Treponema sp.]|nr:SAP domain-containing protein [Treponema sp.]